MNEFDKTIVYTVRIDGGIIFEDFWKGRRGYQAHKYELAIRARLAQYPVENGCYQIPIGGGDGTCEIANMLEALDKENAELIKELRASPFRIGANLGTMVLEIRDQNEQLHERIRKAICILEGASEVDRRGICPKCGLSILSPNCYCKPDERIKLF